LGFISTTNKGKSCFDSNFNKCIQQTPNYQSQSNLYKGWLQLFATRKHIVVGQNLKIFLRGGGGKRGLHSLAPLSYKPV